MEAKYNNAPIVFPKEEIIKLKLTCQSNSFLLENWYLKNSKSCFFFCAYTSISFTVFEKLWSVVHEFMWYIISSSRIQSDAWRPKKRNELKVNHQPISEPSGPYFARRLPVSKMWWPVVLPRVSRRRSVSHVNGQTSYR